MRWLRPLAPVRGITVIIACLALAQALFAYRARHIDPARDYLAPVPSPASLDALAFGDRIFLHRLYALMIQNAGDTGGRIVPVRNYDFARVVGWLDVLLHLDPRSSFATAMAARYFGLSQDVRDVAPIVRFIMRDVATNPQLRWHWLYDAIYLARHRLKDDNLALEVAFQLASYDFKGVDFWASLTPAFILEDNRRYREAADVVRSAERRFSDRMSADDRTWTANYLVFLAKVERGEARPRKLTFH
jgi:hypothetical protein